MFWNKKKNDTVIDFILPKTPDGNELPVSNGHRSKFGGL